MIALLDFLLSFSPVAEILFHLYNSINHILFCSGDLESDVTWRNYIKYLPNHPDCASCFLLFSPPVDEILFQLFNKDKINFKIS